MRLPSRSSKIYVAGHRGMVGSALVRLLQREGYSNLLLRTSGELDLRDQYATNAFFAEEQPEYVVVAAAKVGGILANATYPADFIYDNLAIQTNVIHAAYRARVRRLVFLGSSCIYPRLAPQPMQEQHLLSGRLEPTNQWYAISKIAGIKMCQAYRRQYGCDFISLMPTNLYGYKDNFDLETSHVLPALLRKFHEAKREDDFPAQPVTVWGSGKPRREFLFADDLADAILFVLEQEEATLWGVAPDGLLNVGTGCDLSIAELAALIREVVGGASTLEWDTSKPDGTPQKLLDVSRMRRLGWEAKTSLRDGIARTYRWYVDRYAPTEPAPG